MIPDESAFKNFMQKMDIRKNDEIICYDTHGIFSAPRVWFTFKVFGAPNVSVLNGGLPKWKSENYPTELDSNYNFSKIKRSDFNEKDFDYKLDKSKVCNINEILELSLLKMQGKSDEQIIDARPLQRYRGEVSEPRISKRTGHVDGAINIFFKDFLKDGCYKSKEEIAKLLESHGISSKDKITLYCGSGLTACVDLLGISLLGKFDDLKLYDGSWAEMGNVTEDDNPLLKKIKKININ